MQALLTDNLTLRPLKKGYARKMYETVWKNRARLREAFPWPEQNYSVEIATLYIADCKKKQKAGTALTLGIFWKSQLIGSVSLRDISESSSISYWIDSSFEGKGITKKALRELCNTAFKDYSIERLYIYTGSENINSQRLALSLNFQKDSAVNSGELVNGRYINHLRYRMNKKEWLCR